MDWTQDKVKHYDVCFNAVSKTPLPLRPITFIVMILVGALKELIYDFLLGKGTPEWNYFKADFYGAWDGIFNKRRLTNNLPSGD